MEAQKCQLRDCNHQRETVTNWEILSYYRKSNFSDEILVLKIHHSSSLFSLFLTFLEEESNEHKNTNKKQTIHINNPLDLWS